MEDTQMITGHCECGKITFQVNGLINDFSHCHCSQCRRLHGAAFASFAGVERSQFSYLSGEEDLATYSSSDSHQRVFCRHCGSNILAALDDEPESYYLAMGAVDGNPVCPPGYHMFVASKAPWYTITDDLTQFDSFPDE